MRPFLVEQLDIEMSVALSESDLSHVLNHAGSAFRALDGARIFVTGGTGFVGKWLLESLIAARNEWNLDIEAVVLTRNPEGFCEHYPHLCDHRFVSFLNGDVRSFPFQSSTFTHCIHAATEADFALSRREPRVMGETIVSGTRRVLDFAADSGIKRLLYVSSGAVYGRQPAHLGAIPEDWIGAPNPVSNPDPYAHGKRYAEHLCAMHGRETGAIVTVARLFAFIGPYLPLDRTFAVGNFLRDGLAGGPISVAGNGSAIRSYLYAADLAAWLWTILANGEQGDVYNVGGSQPIRIDELAMLIAKASGQGVNVIVLGDLDDDTGLSRYVPDTARAMNGLGLKDEICLDDAIRRTLSYARRNFKGLVS